MSEPRRGVWQAVHDTLRDAIRNARLRARAERALPRRQRVRRWVRRFVVDLAKMYVGVNLLLGFVLPKFLPVEVVVTGRIDVLVVADETGAPVADARVWRQEWEAEIRTDGEGRSALTQTSTPRLYWAFPMLGSYSLGGQVHTEAAGYLAAETPLPERFEWPLLGEPHATVTIRLRR